MSMIRGRKRPVPSRLLLAGTRSPRKPRTITSKVDIPATLHNRFDIEVIDVNTGEVRERAQAENVICTALWTRLFTPATYFNYIHYGTGSGTPASTDTALFTFLGYKAPDTSYDSYSVSNGANKYFTVQRRAQLDETTAVGSTLTEIGIGYSTGSTTLCTHAMLKDMNGNQISIAKTATDIINIYATVYIRFGALGDELLFMDGAKAVKGRYLAQYFGGISWAHNITYATPIKSHWSDITMPDASPALSSVTSAYSSANKTLTLTVARWAVGDYNTDAPPMIDFNAGRQILEYSSTNSYCYTSIMKLVVGGTLLPGYSVTSEAIGTGDGETVDFSTAFPIVSGMTLYVDSVATSGYTLDEGVPPAGTDMGYYFIPLPDYSSAESTSTYMRNYPSATTNTQGPYSATSAAEVFYNPYYAKGLDSCYCPTAAATLECSNDLSTWYTISADYGNVTIPTEYKNYKYWRFSNGCYYNWVSSGINATNIHFTTAPTSGSVITADYTTKTIPKDSNHVFDLEIVLTFGEYTA